MRPNGIDEKNYRRQKVDIMAELRHGDDFLIVRDGFAEYG